jgi:DNA polymerase-3 subunit delta'
VSAVPAGPGAAADDPFGAGDGQQAAVAMLRHAAANPHHAYLFVGPRGSGKRALAAAFAAAVLSEGTTGAEAERHRRLARAEQHPDLVLVVPEGRTLRRVEAEILIKEGSRSPVEGSHKIIVADRFHTAEPEAAASLLKTIEEPPATAVFVLLAEEVAPEQITIASRCVRVVLPALPDREVAAHLVATGMDPALAASVAAAAGGNIDRARLLASDESFAARRQAWHDVPTMLDGTGAMAARLVEGLRAMIDDAAVPLAERQRVEVAGLAAWEEQYGQRGSGRRELEERHRREVRLLREDELRFGLATLARVYRDRLLDDDPAPAIAALGAIGEASAALVRNPNEALLLQALLSTLAAPLR